MAAVVLPGDTIPVSSLLPNIPYPRLGPGVHQSRSTSATVATAAGLLTHNQKKRTIAITHPHARYAPAVNDLVIAQFHHSSSDYFHMGLTPHYPQAILGQLAFENVTKKTRPQLKPGDLVYAKVLSANRNMEVELTCVNPSTGKSDPEGLGVLDSGMVWEVSTGFATRLLKREGVVILDELGSKMKATKGFEVAVGKNGKVWVDCGEGGVKGCLALGRCLKETDEKNLTEPEQKKLVNKIVAELGLG
ncbi:putative exosome complex exonuclease rrp40 [Phaeomoniella chlamydospora]|uniref:Putative exosome complex exonuclease rrp40 n=1 Tax=Phaeomoniella chlamydospora TaxID=158046 RepID=A0A0G2GNG6_PHACM|nr:putative exosome complex exonuclease rrp40 [Phaeomoniella chlamydospora]